MKRWLILLTAGALVSCAATSPNPWQSVEVPTGAAQQPLELPRWPVPEVFDEQVATYTLGQVRALDAFRTTSEANYGIAREHASAIDAQTQAIVSLVEAGKAQRTLADMRTEMLAEERRSRLYERFGWVTIVVGLGIAALD